MAVNRTLAWGLVPAAIAAVAVVAFVSIEEKPSDVVTGPLASAVPPQKTDAGRAIELLPPTAAAGSTDPALGRGRVERIYVRAAQGVLLDAASQAGARQQGARYASIDFPDPRGDGTTRALALLPDGTPMGVGDVVEMRFVNKGVKDKNPFYKVETDRVTRLVARSDTQLAQDFQRRIAARMGADPPDAQAADPGLWKSLPLDQAVKIVRGAGTRKLAMFSDPYCPACKAIEQSLEQLDDVTLYVFMTPLIRPDKSDDSKSVWCSADRPKAWVDLAARSVVPSAAPTCDNPVEAVTAFSRKIELRATPTLIFEDGRRAQGNLPLNVLRERLAGAGQKVARAQ